MTHRFSLRTWSSLLSAGVVASTSGCAFLVDGATAGFVSTDAGDGQGDAGDALSSDSAHLDATPLDAAVSVDAVTTDLTASPDAAAEIADAEGLAADATLTDVADLDAGLADAVTAADAVADSKSSDSIADVDTANLPDAATPSGSELPPVGITLLLPWLKAHTYQTWKSEPAIHKSKGPHSFVRIYVNAALAASLGAGATVHPANSATVKEVYGVDGVTPKGWAVLRKLAPDSAGGQNWYWFETATLDGSAGVFVDGPPTTTCLTCHEKSTQDYIKTKAFAPPVP